MLVVSAYIVYLYTYVYLGVSPHWPLTGYPLHAQTQSRPILVHQSLVAHDYLWPSLQSHNKHSCDYWCAKNVNCWNLNLLKLIIPRCMPIFCIMSSIKNDCYDKYDKCKLWKGENAWPCESKFMTILCPVTCGLCHGPSQRKLDKVPLPPITEKPYWS
ncbi:unnamed protein product, partial [Meganyctiphanes norvegica]